MPDSKVSDKRPAKYDEATIAKELRETASGARYHGNALWVAMDMPAIIAKPRLRAAMVRLMSGHDKLTIEDRLLLDEAADLISANGGASGYQPKKAVRHHPRPSALPVSSSLCPRRCTRHHVNDGRMWCRCAERAHCCRVQVKRWRQRG